MSKDMVVIAFDTEDKAKEVLKTMKGVQHNGYMRMEDTVVVRKDADGKVHAKNAIDKTTKEGTTVGGFLGLFLGFLFGGPLGAMLLGGVIGGAFGALQRNGVDKKFIKDVSEAIQPGTSALFIVIRSADVAIALAAFRKYEGTVLHSTLPEELEDSLKRSLKQK